MADNRYLVIYWKIGSNEKGIVKFCKERINGYIWLTKEEVPEVYAEAKRQKKKNLMILKRAVSFERGQK